MNMVNYFIYVLSEDLANSLLKSFDNNINCISQFKYCEIKKGDFILLFRKTTNVKKKGYIGICNAKTDFMENIDNIKVFKDLTMNKYCCKINNLILFDNIIKTNELNNELKINIPEYKSSQSFSHKYFKTVDIIVKITDNYGDILTNIILGHHVLKHDSTDSESELSDDSTDSEYDESTDSESELSNDSDIYIIKGHIPILFEPCKKFIWEGDLEKKFKKHYTNCEKCKRTDNNELSSEFVKYLDKAKYKFKQIKDKDEIESYCDLYYNLNKCIFEVQHNAKNNNYITVLRFVNREHVYNRCLFILW